MYPVRLGFGTAKSRIRRLMKNGHHAEALLTSVFTFEKIIHRTLKQLVVSAGFKNADADRLLKQIQGFKKQKEIWTCFDPEGRALPAIIGNTHWQHVNKAVEMRNRLVHGLQTYPLDACRAMTENMLELLDQTVRAFKAQYAYDGWSRVAVRYKPTLHTDPKVSILNDDSSLPRHGA